MFRQAFRSFLDKEVVPRSREFDEAGIVPRDVWESAGASGFLAFAAPEAYGGAGMRDFRYSVVVAEEMCDADTFGAVMGITLHKDGTLPYFLDWTNDEQKARWLPDIVAGRAITAVAMTEPGMGSDLAGMATTAKRDGDTY